MIEFSEFTEIVEFPAIVVNNTVKFVDPSLPNMTDALFKDMATALGGQFVYLKVRATYTQVEVQMCTRKDCTRPAKLDTLVCGDH
jgi:hypothetical protein